MTPSRACGDPPGIAGQDLHWELPNKERAVDCGSLAVSLALSSFVLIISPLFTSTTPDKGMHWLAEQ